MNNLTKDINNIINNYLDVSTKHLIKIIPKKRISMNKGIKKGITLLDILIKCLQLGYNGFYINSDIDDNNYRLTDEINDDRISHDIKDNEYFFYFDIPELRHMKTMIDINRLDIFDIESEYTDIID